MGKYIQGYKFITIHHTVTSAAKTAADLPALARSMENYHATMPWAEEFKTGGEFGYSYIEYDYLFAMNGEYIQVQDPKYIRIHASDSARGANSHNLHGIPIAIVGNMEIDSPSQALIDGIARLCAELEKKYKVDFIIKGHKETALYADAYGNLYYPEVTGVYYTSCPGKNMGLSTSGAVKKIIDRTNAFLTEKPWYESVVKTPLKLINPKDANLYAIDSGAIVKPYPANTQIGVDYTWNGYYLTEYSVANKIKNGFKMSEWNLYMPEPTTTELKAEIDRLNGELKALQASYKISQDSLEDKSFEIEELNFDMNKLKEEDKAKDAQIVSLTNDVAWQDDKIAELEKELAESTPILVEELPWGTIITGILKKLTGLKEKKPE